MVTLHLTSEIRVQLQATRIERMGLTDPHRPIPQAILKPKKVPVYRTPEQQRLWDALLAAWRANPKAKGCAIAERFHVSCSTAHKAKVAALHRCSIAKKERV